MRRLGRRARGGLMLQKELPRREALETNVQAKRNDGEVSRAAGAAFPRRSVRFSKPAPG